jgi:outer membrane protein OmpA-like peptidoglycan-associated protein
MKIHLLLLVLTLYSVPNTLFAQCNFITPAETTKMDYANRQVTFSNCTINGKKTNVVYVQKGESIAMQVNMKVIRNGDYCPSCIVQLYWGINNYVSTCAVSFYGYEVSAMNSTQNFKAPDKDGVYYVTLGGTLDYSCKNTRQRPECDPKWAFAVIVVGTPNPEKKMLLNMVHNSNMLQTKLIKSGCFGQMSELKWYKDGVHLPGETTPKIAITAPGTYRAVWKSCFDSIYMEKTVDVPVIKKDTIITAVINEPVKNDTTSLDYQIEHSDKFILNNLEFAVQSAVLTEDSKKELDKLAKILNDKPTITIRLEGHTDVIGATDLNLKLSQQRVQSTKKYLLSKGINGKRSSTKGFGGTRPITNGTSEEERKKNRRVEIVILSR